MSTSLKSLLKCGLIVSLMFSLPSIVSASTSASSSASTPNSLGAVADTVVTSFASIVKLITAVCYVTGMGFAMGGIMKFKSHKDNPQQTPLSQPIILVIVAAALLFLPAVLQTAGVTLFGTSGAKAGAGSTTGFDSINN